MQALACANCGAPLPAPEGTGTLTCTYCDFSHQALAEPTTPEDPNATFEAGDAVAVFWGSKWWPATVLRVIADDVWEIHYDGWGDKWNEMVGPDRMRPRTGATPGSSTGGGATPGMVALLIAVGLFGILAVGAVAAIAALGSPGANVPAGSGDRQPITPTGVAIPPGLLLPVGAAIEVEWNDSWYAATVTAERPDGSVGVTYTGWGSSFDESVDPERVRVPAETLQAARGPVSPSGTPLTSITAPDGTEVNVGDVLEVQWRDDVYRAVALTGLNAERQVRVHYAGWEDQWDELVEASRIRLVEH